MQCRGYLPVYHSHYDLNVDTSGGSRPVCNGNGAFRSGQYNNHVSTSPVPQANFAHKELLGETMVMHEVTFRDQVQELHRLYKRQRELMTEIKSKALFKDRLKLEVQSSNSSSAQLFSSGQDNLHSLPFLSSQNRTAPVNTDNLQRAFNCIKVTTPDIPIASQNDIPVGTLPESKGKRIGGKLLDLELPAEVYIDNDEWESLDDARYVFPTINSEKSAGLADEAKSEVQISSSDKKPSCNLGKSLLVVQALPSFNDHSRTSKNAKLYHRSTGSTEKGLSGLSFDIQSSCPESKFLNGCCSIDLNSAVFDPFNGKNGSCSNYGLLEVSSSCENVVAAKQNGINYFINSLDGENMRKTKRCGVIDINLPFDPATEDESFTEDLGQIDLNICLADDILPTNSFFLDKNYVEIDLEAPTSPEVEERAPPRGGTPGEWAHIAAEVIVSMSCKKTLLFSDTKKWQNCDISDRQGLEWFAELVYSFSTEIDNDIGRLSLNEIDDFEAMTLKLTEVKSEEYICGNPVEISSQTSKKGRTKRSKKNDFQREVLPALSSLSRVEVTEDIQIIEGLMEAAGTPWQLRTRRACRMGRKPQMIKILTPTTDVPELKGELVMSWGRVNRRPRGHRSRVSRAVFMSRWLEFTAR